MSRSIKRILIQACSGRKAVAAEKVPALELYDGTAFRVIKKYLREKEIRQPDFKLLILSAEYGLIDSETLIATYDRKMDKTRSKDLQSDVKRIWDDGRYTEQANIFINLGKLYFPAFDLIVLPSKTVYAAGGIGHRNSQLKKWLHGEL